MSRLSAVLVLFLASYALAALTGRYGHSSVYFSKDRRLVVYGGKPSPASVLVFNVRSPSDLALAEYSFASPADPLYSLSDVSAAPSLGNLMLFFGFDETRKNATNNAHKLSVTSNQISTEAVNVSSTRPNPRYNAAATNLNDTHVFLQGGVDGVGASVNAGLKALSGAFIYSSLTQSFYVVPPPLPPARWDHTATRTQSGKIVLLGGTTTHLDTISMSQIWVFSEETGFSVVNTTGDIPASRRGHSAVAGTINTSLLLNTNYLTSGRHDCDLRGRRRLVPDILQRRLRTRHDNVYLAQTVSTF
jgi:hypothetical protein